MSITPARKSPADVGARIRALRAERRLTLAQMSDASGLTRSFLSKLERGQSAVSVASLLKIAAALEAPLAALFEPAVGAAVVRADQDSAAPTESNSRRLTPQAERRIEAMRNNLSAGDMFERARSEVMIEFIHVISGTLEIELEGGLITLHQGDSVTISAETAGLLRSPRRGIGTSFLSVYAPV